MTSTGQNILAAASLILLLGSSQQAYSHHGWSWYGNQPFTLTAEVLHMDLGNPHDRLIVSVDGQQWTVLLSPPARSRRAGFNEESIAVGDTITIHGHRRSDGQDNFEIKTARIQAGERLYDFYPNRG